MLQAEQIVQNYEDFITLINKNFSGNRLKKLLKIYEEDFKDRVLYAPASNRSFFHSAFPGGYLYHVLNVTRNAIMVSNLWTELGQRKDYTDEELIFSAINHDLGKLGTIDQPYYLDEDNKWQRDNRGQMYKFNENLEPYMTVEDRSLYTLQQYGIEVTPTEYLSIKLHDGLYHEGNKDYYISFSEIKQLKTNLPYILHQADLISTRIEWGDWKELGNKNYSPTPIRKKTVPKKYEDKLKQIFGD